MVPGRLEDALAFSARILPLYYALASEAITVGIGVGRFRRNMPDPIPVAVLGRLAIDHSQQGRGSAAPCSATALCASPMQPVTLMVTLADIRELLG